MTPPDNVLGKFLPPGVRFIGGKREPGPSFLSKRLEMDKNWGDDDNTFYDDSDRLQNVVLFLKDIRGALESMDKVLWMRLDPGRRLLADVRAECRTLREARHGAEYRSGIFKKRHGNRTSLAFVLAVKHDLLALTLEILTRESEFVTGAAQVQLHAFREAFSELDRFVQTECRKEHIVEIAELVVKALHPVAQRLGMLPSTPQPELEPPTLTIASSSTAQGVGLDPEPQLRTGGDEVAPDGIPASPTGSATGSSPTSPNESSYPSRSLTSSSEDAGRDPTALV
ncbi:hypothetical protein BJV77DRAFT_1011744 [Russula vinacea]|nr:hypothetical protein BJV77DRAFT_1011744 [Russula vinacea]